ncbi:MAG: hypothetical protein N2C14_06815 [Planctomycetales bacterium]
MSIKDRIDDAFVLWNSDRKEGAWIMGLVAAAATSKKRHPRPVQDNEAFKQFINAAAVQIMSGDPTKPGVQIVLGTQEEGITLGELLYKEMRCCLLHEAVLGSGVALSPSKIVDGKLHATFKVGEAGEPNEIPDFVVWNLLQAVKDAEENKGEFT